jgi:hypothetical protein
VVNTFLWQQINMQQWRNCGSSVFWTVQAKAVVKTSSWVEPILGCNVRCQYRTTINEDIGEWEDLVFVVVICRVCRSVKMLWLLIVKSYKHSINPVISQNPVSSHWLMTAGVRNGIGFDWIVGIILLCIIGLEPTWWIILADLGHLVATMESLEVEIVAD